MMNEFTTVYIGIVLQNNDPEQRGRVKVWVPHVQATAYDKWNATKKDKKFKFPGKNIGSDLSLIIEELKDDLPWAEACSPIMGSTATGAYQSYNDIGTISDATFKSSLSGSNYSNTLPQYNLNSEQFGEKPAAVFEKYISKLGDAFTDTNAIKSNQVNQYGFNYRPASYSNAAEGLFSIPNVGAHVWVMFRDGMVVYPMYFGAVLSSDDFASIFQTTDGVSSDYPQTYENKDIRTRAIDDTNTNTYRNKMVLNQRGAAIEIISTMRRESFKITQYAGGFFEMNNRFSSIFSPSNFQQFTLKDRFETVKGHNNLFVGRDYDEIVQGDRYFKIGNLNSSAISDWYTAYQPIAAVLAQFESVGGKSANLSQAVINATTALAAAEAKMGMGGNMIETISKHKVVNVGLMFNHLPSARINSTGKTVWQYLNVNSSGVLTSQTNTPLLEYVYMDDPPGGNYTITAANRFNLLVGSGGMDLKTTGPVNLGGSIVNVVGQQLNLSSENEINIDGGRRLTLTADVLTIKQRNHEQVLLDSNFGITRNLVLGGSGYVNGELFVQHITAPLEYQETEATEIQAGSGKWAINLATITKAGGGVISSGDTVSLSLGTLQITQSHSHKFKNLPLTLVTDNTAVRTAAAIAVNGTVTTPGAATAVTNGYKAPTVSPYTYNGPNPPSS